MELKPYSPNSHVVDFLNSARSRSAVARTIRNYRRLVLGHTRGRSIDYDIIDGLLALRNAQPEGKLTEYAQIQSSGLISDHLLEVLTAATREENRVILPAELKSRPAMRLGAGYFMALQDFPFPDYVLQENSYFDQQYYGLPKYSVIAPYVNYLIGPQDSRVQMSIDRIEMDGLEVRSAVLRFSFSYDHVPGKYQMAFDYGDGRIDLAPLSMDVEFKPYVVSLGTDDLFALRYGFTTALPAEGGAEGGYQEGSEVVTRQVVVLRGKRDMAVPSRSRSLLQAFLPRQVVPSKFRVETSGGAGVDFLTDVRISNLFSNRETIVGISGKSQDAPDNLLSPKLRFYEKDGEIVQLENEAGQKLPELVVRADTNQAMGVEADLGGYISTSGIAAIYPQVSFLVKPKENISVTKAFVYFVGAYHQSSRKASDEVLQLRQVDSVTARAGDNVERAMAVFGRVNGRDGSKNMLLLFNKGLVMAYDCLDLTKRPRMSVTNQVSDPNGADALNFTPEKDVLNPGLNIAFKRNKKGIYASSPKDAGPRKPNFISPGDSHVGGRRYGIIYLHDRAVSRARDGAQSILTIAHSLPRGANDNGAAQLSEYTGDNTNPKTEKPYGLPAQATVTVYPPLGLDSKGFLRSEWRFALKDGVTPTKPNSDDNGNESYLYRHFRECFRKGGEKAPAKLQRDFFNGQGLQGGTPVRSIQNYGTNRPLFFISEVPFLLAIPVRTFMIDSLNGRTLLDVDDMVALELYDLSGGSYLLLAMRRTLPKPTENKGNVLMIDYFKEFEMVGIQVTVQQSGDAVQASLRPLSTAFGKEQPFFLSFDELDEGLIPSNIGVQGTAAHQIAPEVFVQGQKYILTATPKSEKQPKVILHLYRPVVEGDGTISLQKEIPNIRLPEGNCSLIRVTQDLQAQIPLHQAPVESYYGSSQSFVNDTVFIVQQESTGAGGMESVLLFCKLGKDESGAFALIPGELVTEIANFS